MKSFSEIETTTKRASRAAGYSWGIAEEVGKSIRLLELYGFPGIKNLNQYYQNKKKEKYQDIKIINQINKSDKSFYCPIMLGVSFLDQIKKLETLKKCSFQGIAYPILLLPFLSRCSEIIGKKIFLEFEENKFLLNFNLSISSNYFQQELPIKSDNTEIIFLENKDSFSDVEWKNLYKLSENTFVEENDSLKQGAAGAGLTDND
ncbi:DUF3726 domain-containing protein [Candidatus Pelagibacter sp.]|jgi:hypothetical protein|nr:DUF3726 domain-containing protein [Candidatus Pelagibacter sp.]|tara:strand:- start:561 stop:1172 length:612 start_codon:yes stop_codon:yes gene_type:complete